jgi:RNA polymerase sigma-B factor
MRIGDASSAPQTPGAPCDRRREGDGIVADEDVRSEDQPGHPRSPVYPQPSEPSEGTSTAWRTSAERDAMVERHLGLARHLALRYSDSGEPLEDLVQVASLGLVYAVDRFVPSGGIAFTTFAVPTILGELKRHFRDRGWAIHVPRDLKEAALRVRRAIAEHPGERPPTPAELAQATGLSLEGVLEALQVGGMQRALSLDAPASSDEDGSAALGDLLGGDDAELARAHDRTLLASLLRTVTPLEREILRLRFVEDLTQSEIGERIGVSQMQISRILRGALTRMRAAARVDDEPAGDRRP